MPGAVWNAHEGRWTYSIYKDGTRKRFASKIAGPAGRREVYRRAREWEESGKSRRAPTVATVWPEYLEDVAARSSAANWRTVEQMGRLYILPAMGEKKLANLHEGDWQKFLNTVRGTSGKVLAEKSIKNIRATISNFLTYCFRCGLVASRENSLYIPKNHPTYSKAILQPDEVRRLFSDEFAGNWFINLWRLMVLTGMRPGEAMGLQWSDITSTCIQINRAINYKNEITPGKNKNTRREIPLSALVLDVLAEQKARTAHLESEWLFCNQLGQEPRQRLAYDYWVEIAQALGRPDVAPYGLRHTFISMVRGALPEQMVKDIVGHSVNFSTFETYGHKLDGQDQKTASALDAFFSSSLPSLSSSRTEPEKIPEKPSGARITRLGS